ncbi:glycosyltransferase [Arthrobacter pigmenti]
MLLVLPTISVDDWLDAAVASVLAQEGVVLELVVVHDGVAPDYARWWACDPRVTIMHNEKRSGLSFSLSKAISSSDHEFVARLDADDLCLAGRLKRQYDYMTQNPDVVIVGTNATRIDSDGTESGSLGSGPDDDIRHKLLVRNKLIHSSVFFRRSAYSQCGGYNPQLRQMEDYDLWLRMAGEGKVAVIGEPLIAYRVHGKQMSRGAKPWGPHIQAVIRSRRQLGRRLRRSVVDVSCRQAIWLVAQFARYFRMKKMGYER